MKRLLYLPLMLALGGLAFGQINIPPCNGTNGPNCTDYFSAGNWANSPVPSSPITGFTLIAGGSGYVNPQVVITDATGTGATATATADSSGIISAVTVGAGGSGYIMPQVTIVDVGPGGTLALPTCGAAPLPSCGSGAMATAVLGGPFTGGMPKFVSTDLLPGLPIAVPDTTTFPDRTSTSSG